MAAFVFVSGWIYAVIEDGAVVESGVRGGLWHWRDALFLMLILQLGALLPEGDPTPD